MEVSRSAGNGGGRRGEELSVDALEINAWCFKEARKSYLFLKWATVVSEMKGMGKMFPVSSRYS